MHRRARLQRIRAYQKIQDRRCIPLDDMPSNGELTTIVPFQLDGRSSDRNLHRFDGQNAHWHPY